MAANTAVGICMMVLGAGLSAGGFVTAQRKPNSTGSAAHTPPSVGESDAESGDPPDQRGA